MPAPHVVLPELGEESCGTTKKFVAREEAAFKTRNQQAAPWLVCAPGYRAGFGIFFLQLLVCTA